MGIGCHSRRLTAVGALAAAILLAAGLAVADDRPSCVDVTGHARYDGTGYMHVVRVENGCDQAVQCEVWTSVDEERHNLRVDAGETGQVVTRRGSPAYEFEPHADCTLVD